MRNSYNAIRSFRSEDGTGISDPIPMSNLALRHFQSILAHDILPPMNNTVGWFHNLTPYKCHMTLRISMSTAPTNEEIEWIMMKLNPNKAPSPYGLTSWFFREVWPIMGNKLLSAIRNFFVTCFLPLSTNATILALVPKNPCASTVSDYRHVSCYNTLYKVISKLLVIRLKLLLPEFIVPNQTTFVKGRLLVDNTMLAYEIVQGYHKNQNPKRITIKVDIAKAFDTVIWDFILSLLRGINVPKSFIRWLQACLCNTAFSIGYNGMVHDFFKGKKGLRQGDPPVSASFYPRNELFVPTSKQGCIRWKLHLSFQMQRVKVNTPLFCR